MLATLTNKASTKRVQPSQKYFRPCFLKCTYLKRAYDCLVCLYLEEENPLFSVVPDCDTLWITSTRRMKAPFRRSTHPNVVLCLLKEFADMKQYCTKTR